MKGVTVWFTGLPCSGKTTIADKVAENIKSQGFKVERLDGDLIRKGLTSDLGFSKLDRDENIKRVTFVAKLLTRNGVKVLATFVSPYKERRRKTREEIGDFLEVYVKCPLDECIKRDVKGMYQKAISGEIKGFTGVDDPYEEPEDAELVLETDKLTIDECAARVISVMDRFGYL
jgi:adenylyl-sulfate kinase